MRRTLALLALAVCLLAALPGSAAAADLGSRTLKLGSQGADVTQLQQALLHLGYEVSVDGRFGRQTKRAVRRFERTRSMKVDGRVTRRDARRIARVARRDGQSVAGGATPEPPSPAAPAEPPAEADAGYVFPVQGAYSLGTESNAFGAPRGTRSHQGQDLLAAEGTPLVSVSAGRVHVRAYQGTGAGHYIVIRGNDGFDYAYMHLRDRALPDVGDEVASGERIGYVGNTGASQGAHLHFEIWRGGWYAGGSPVDPLPYLVSWAT